MSPDDPFRYILVGAVFVILGTSLVHRLRARTGEKLDRKQEGLFILVTLRLSGLVGFIGMGVYLYNPADLAFNAVSLPTWLRWAGVGLGGLTAGLLYWTLRNLGKNLTDTVVTRQQHTLVTTGPYQWVRHPFYVCAALLIATLTLVSANVFFLMPGGLVLLLLVFRTRIEERNLLTRFGEDYRDYMTRTGRFFPRLSRRVPVPGTATENRKPTQGT
jgi:protein-S-isoprenylcysteine O-methyltransferase Ste14